jgi:hypothetical protein
MRQLLAIVGLTGIALTGSVTVQPIVAADDSPPVPVVAELYTSEGCSDCPPADQVLTDLVTEQPLDGVQVIALGEHVDYWNYLGWTDRFSSAALTQRQKDYQTSVFSPTPVYTPQLIVDGHLQSIGSDRAAVQRALRRAASETKAQVRLAVGEPQAGRVSATIAFAPSADMTLGLPADVLVAVVEDGLVTDVPRGENRGRTLEHNAVVRRIGTVGEIAHGNGDARLTTSIVLAEDWQTERLRIIAFVQERDSRRIIGAASAEVPD